LVSQDQVDESLEIGLRSIDFLVRDLYPNETVGSLVPTSVVNQVTVWRNRGASESSIDSRDIPRLEQEGVLQH